MLGFQKLCNGKIRATSRISQQPHIFGAMLWLLLLLLLMLLVLLLLLLLLLLLHVPQRRHRVVSWWCRVSD